MIKEIMELYDDVIDLRDRLSNDGTGEIYEEDYLLLDDVLDLLEDILLEDE